MSSLVISLLYLLLYCHCIMLLHIFPKDQAKQITPENNYQLLKDAMLHVHREQFPCTKNTPEQTVIPRVCILLRVDKPKKHDLKNCNPVQNEYLCL